MIIYWHWLTLEQIDAWNLLKCNYQDRGMRVSHELRSFVFLLDLLFMRYGRASLFILFKCIYNKNKKEK